MVDSIDLITYWTQTRNPESTPANPDWSSLQFITLGQVTGGPLDGKTVFALRIDGAESDILVPLTEPSALRIIAGLIDSMGIGAMMAIVSEWARANGPTPVGSQPVPFDNTRRGRRLLGPHE